LQQKKEREGAPRFFVPAIADEGAEYRGHCTARKEVGAARADGLTFHA